MGELTCRPCEYTKDRQRLIELLLAHRAVTDVRIYPTVWRMLLLLTSRVWNPEKDTCLWENAGGALAGFAMLWRRQPTSPYLVLDWIAHPSLVTSELLSSILIWGDQRAREIATETSTSFPLYTHGSASYNFESSKVPGNKTSVSTRNEATKESLLDHLGKLGYSPLLPNPEVHDVYYASSLHEIPPAPALPAGYSIRSLKGTADLEAYRSVYGFASVNQHHQEEQLSSDDYCCLVVANPAGEFVAYCECSTWRAEWELSGRRIGWIDYVETKESEQGKGLGRAALTAGLEQLHSWGAETAMLLTVSNNSPAVRLYEKTGFSVANVVEPDMFEKIMSSKAAAEG